ncbi:MAG: zf-HC2 domain-containing protein [Rhodothermales bacterium]
MLKKLTHMVRGLPTCRTVAAFLADYLEGRLSEKTVHKFEEHIAMCPNCGRYLQQYKETLRMLKDMPAPEPPPELAEMTCEFLRDSLGARDS